MEVLTLPGPAGELWAAKRDVIHSLPAEVFGQPIRPHIGGGTTLAARWKHRLSTDIDILLPGRNTLIDLLQDDERNVVRRLGGEPEAVTDRRAKIAFTRGKIDLCILKPDPAQGHAEALVDGEREVVLTSAQIEVEVEGARLTVRRAIAGGPLSPESYEADDAAGALIRSGIAAHLNSNGPISAPQLLAAIRTATARKLSLTVYDSADAESARQIRRAAERRRV